MSDSGERIRKKKFQLAKVALSFWVRCVTRKDLSAVTHFLLHRISCTLANAVVPRYLESQISMSVNVENERGTETERQDASSSLPRQFSAELNDHMPVPFEALDFSFDPSFLASDKIYDPTLGRKRTPTYVA